MWVKMYGIIFFLEIPFIFTNKTLCRGIVWPIWILKNFSIDRCYVPLQISWAVNLLLSLVFIVHFLPNNGPHSTFEASPDYVPSEVSLTQFLREKCYIRERERERERQFKNKIIYWAWAHWVINTKESPKLAWQTIS